MRLSTVIRDKFELGDVLHMTHIDNLNSILNSKALFSKKYVDQNVKTYKDISDQSVQDGRSRIVIPCTGNELHEYVPFYWGRKTPMVSSLRGQNKDLIFLQFFSDILEENECVITDGNARTSGTMFKSYNDISDLNILDSRSINTVKYADDPEVKRKKQSEVLVHNSIGLGRLKCIICHSEDVKTKIELLISTHRVNCGVYVNIGAYYFKL
jgi:hypothetical protein